MISRRSFILGVLPLGFAHQTVQADSVAEVHGQFRLKKNNAGIPGLHVFLVHQVLGRSAVSVSDADGRFGWKGVPIHPEPYYLEAYWGEDLEYRHHFTVSQSPLILPPMLL